MPERTARHGLVVVDGGRAVGAVPDVRRTGA